MNNIFFSSIDCLGYKKRIELHGNHLTSEPIASSEASSLIDQLLGDTDDCRPNHRTSDSTERTPSMDSVAVRLLSDTNESDHIERFEKENKYYSTEPKRHAFRHLQLRLHHYIIPWTLLSTILSICFGILWFRQLDRLQKQECDKIGSRELKLHDLNTTMAISQEPSAKCQNPIGRLQGFIFHQTVNDSSIDFF